MAQKSYAKHSEFRTYSTKGSYNDKELESMKTELLPNKYAWQDPISSGIPDSNKEYYCEYSEEKNPTGTYNKKDLHTVEQYEYTTSPGDVRYNQCGHLAIANTPPKLINSTTHTTTTNRDLSHNIEELDTLLDDLQKDQERKLYKGGYTSDTMDTSSFDYRSTKPYKTTEYSLINKVDRDVEWMPSPPPKSATISKEITRNQITETHVLPVAPQQVPAIVCTKCQGHSNTLVSNTHVSGTPMNKITTTVKTYTYEVPADQDPTTLPIPGITSPNTTISEKYSTNEHNRVNVNEIEDHRTYVNTQFNTSTPIKHAPPQPVTNTLPPPSPQTGCQYCSHCNSRITTTSTTTVAGSPMPHHRHPSPHGVDSNKITTKTTHYTTSTNGYPGNQGPPYPSNNSPTYAVPVDNTPNRNGPPGSSTYKYTTTNYSTYNTSAPDGHGKPGPFPQSTSPFPRTESPAPRTQELPKKLDDLLAEFPIENYPNDEVRRRNVHVSNESYNGHPPYDNGKLHQSNKKQEVAVITPSKNVEGSAVYYPPGHEMFAGKESQAYQQSGGGYMKAKGAYKYEAESGSKSKTSTSVKAVPVCLPLCCAMPCAIL